MDKKYFPTTSLIFLTMLILILVGGGSPAATPTAVVPSNTPTAVPPADTPTAIPPTAASVGGTWTARADLPTPRWDHNTCVVDGKIYVIGGAGPVYEPLDTEEVYDPASDTWETKSPMPTARQGLSTSVVNGKIYAIGSSASSSESYSSVETFSTVEEYDPATDTWTRKSDMPTSRGFLSANIVDGKIFIIGGSQAAPPIRNHVLTVEMYDPATDTWTQKSEMPTNRFYVSTSALDGKIFAIGGSVKLFYGSQGLATVDVYDPAADTWTTAPDMLTKRLGSRSSVVDGKIYVFGGLPYWISSAHGSVEVYEP